MLGITNEGLVFGQAIPGAEVDVEESTQILARFREVGAHARVAGPDLGEKDLVHDAPRSNDLLQSFDLSFGNAGKIRGQFGGCVLRQARGDIVGNRESADPFVLAFFGLLSGRRARGCLNQQGQQSDRSQAQRCP